MVLSVLEDSDVPVDMNEELFLNLDHNCDKDNKLTYKSSTTPKNEELVTPHEEKLIINYLEGKAMKEEEEKIVLNTLHPEHHSSSGVKQNGAQKQENGCQLSKTISDGHPTTGASNHRDTNITSHVPGRNNNSLMKKINCFRLTVDNLTLTPAGWKKISQAVDNKSKHIVYFGQSSAHSLRPPHTVSEMENVNCLVCWRHLHQRVPALLGTFRLESLLQGSLEVEETLPVVSDNVTVVGHIKLRLQLGKDKLYFGNALLEDSPRDFQTEKKNQNDHEQGKTFRFKETLLLNVKDLENKNTPTLGIKNREHSTVSTTRTQQESHNNSECRNPLPNYVDIPSCANCGQNMILTNAQMSATASLCVSCSSLLGTHQSFIEPNFKISIPNNFTSREKRHHEFLLGVDTVKGFPLFANIQEELKCYVDYKFPQITSGLKAEICSMETTSRVVDVTTQLSLASVHRHSLELPLVLPLSPLLAACSPGITLRLWLRYYKPSPRDHMVAMALLPMDELCLMELEFDERQQEIAITKVFELPLALVPSSVTAPYQKCPSAGTIRISVTYSNFITPLSKLPSNQSEKPTVTHKEQDLKLSMKDYHPEMEEDLYVQHELKPISALLDRISAQNDNSVAEEKLRAEKNRFWTGPFGKENVERSRHVMRNQEPSNKKEDSGFLKNHQTRKSPEAIDQIDSARDSSCLITSHPVKKEDLDILAESIEHRFNQLQSDLLKEKQRGFMEVDSMVMDTRKLNSSLNGEINDDFLSFHTPLSSNSSMESLPFILGPPADFKDIKNTVVCPKGKVISKSASDKSISDTIVRFFKEEKDTDNYSCNDSFDKNDQKPETTKPKTFKANVKIDRAVNLKAVKAPANGKKGKIPPSCWVSFGIADCCEQNCGTSELVCTGPRFTTPVIRRNHNPIWNLSWDIDLPVDYLQQEEKRLVFSVFEEQLGACVGRASASVAILRSGLPCLSTWLSIDDPQGTCRGQLKVVVTPLEDLRQYQNCLVFDMEEDDFEELKEKAPESDFTEKDNKKTPVFVASQTEIFLNDTESVPSKEESAQKVNNQTDNAVSIDGGDPFLADDIISDYKHTLENNFRNEMAGLENLIKFLRVGSMSSELSFFRSTENKENQSSNPTPQYFGGETRSSGTLESYNNVSHIKNTTINHQPLNHNSQKDRCLIDATTETVDKGGFHTTPTQHSSDDILSKLLHQISTFQPPVIKITDNTSQTLIPETKESFTEISDDNIQLKSETNNPVRMKDASTETEDIVDKRSPPVDCDKVASRHVCEELGNVLLQHFLTCKPLPVKVTDNTTQTDSEGGQSTVNSSGVFMSGISIDTTRDNHSDTVVQQNAELNWNQTESQTNSERLAAIDNNIRDLEQFFKENLITDRERTSLDSKDSSMNEIEDFIGNENNQSSSDIESLESYSQVMVFPRETPDGGNPSSVPDLHNPSNCEKTEASLRRQRTFVIEKPIHVSEDLKGITSEDSV